MSLIATFVNEEFFDDVYECDQAQLQDPTEDTPSLNDWYEKTICSFASSKQIEKNVLSDHEVEFVQRHSLISAVDVTYCLLAKYTDKTHDEQISTVLDILSYLGRCRLPKELLGGFLILMIKYHFLP